MFIYLQVDVSVSVLECICVCMCEIVVVCAPALVVSLLPVGSNGILATYLIFSIFYQT